MRFASALASMIGDMATFKNIFSVPNFIPAPSCVPFQPGGASSLVHRRS